MKTQQKENITHIEQVRQRYRNNQSTIQAALGWNELEYYCQEFNVGMEFLEGLYPPDTEFEKYRIYHSRSEEFWRWWHMVFKNYEAQVIAKFDTFHNLYGRQKIWQKYMTNLVNNQHVEVAFLENYQKRTKVAEI